MKKRNNLKFKESGQESKSLLSRKSGQEENLHLNKKISNLHFCLNKKPTKAQEEMVGFGLIIILVAIIFIVFISFYIRKPSQPTEDYEAGSFIQAVLQYTTVCQEADMENLSVQKLIFKCQSGNPCEYRSMDPCQILNNTIKGIVRESWEADSKSPIKGYSFVINVSEDRGRTEEILLKIDSGVVTNNYRGSEQDLGKSGDYLVILFQVYN